MLRYAAARLSRSSMIEMFEKQTKMNHRAAKSQGKTMQMLSRQNCVVFCSSNFRGTEDVHEFIHPISALAGRWMREVSFPVEHQPFEQTRALKQPTSTALLDAKVSPKCTLQLTQLLHARVSRWLQTAQHFSITLIEGLNAESL